MKELLSDFDGSNVSFKKWQKQFRLLCTMYRLDDDHARLLMSTKLRGQALQWFQSKSEYIAMDVENLLRELTVIFDHCQTRLSLRRKFEDRS